MSGFVQIIALGRLGGDPELSYTQGGTAVAKFSIATSRKRGEEEVTTWLRWKAYGKQAELIAEHVKKGELLFCEGRPDQWQAEGERGKVTVTDYIVEHFEFCSARRDADGGRPSTQHPSSDRPARGYSPSRPARGPAERDSQQLNRSGGTFDDDIPF
jgi:single-strand DNA-binding protein